MSFYVFRHGETRQSKDKVPYGDEELTAEILPEAVPVVERIGEYLKVVDFDAGFASEYRRCRQTAEIVARFSGKNFVANPLLNEYVVGEFWDLKKRGQDFISFVLGNGQQSVAVCTHGAMVACLKNLLTTGQFEKENLLDYPKTGVVWGIFEGKVREKNLV